MLEIHDPPASFNIGRQNTHALVRNKREEIFDTAWTRTGITEAAITSGIHCPISSLTMAFSILGPISYTREPCKSKMDLHILVKSKGSLFQELE
jgi:hypothetical protein